MIRKILCVITLLFSQLLLAQSHTVPYIGVGGGGDHTNQPIAAQAYTSHSQTLYYPEQIRFIGEITSISYFTAFSGGFANSLHWEIRIGITDLEEFGNGNYFIPDSELTQVFDGVVVRGTEYTELIAAFTQGFNYDGQHNLVVDVREVDPGRSISGFDGFTGVENFHNPPVRSIMNIDGAILMENSYARTKFGGALQRCIPVYDGTFTNITPTEATAQWTNSENIPAFRYNVNLFGEPVPDAYQLVNTNSVILQNLTPATYYNFNYKGDCDVAPSRFVSQTFATRPLPITVPTEINFDAESAHDYLNIPTGLRNIASYISPLAAHGGGGNGILFRGMNSTNILWAVWDGSGDWFADNPAYLSTVTYNIDLTNTTTGHPAFSFNLRQSGRSQFRVRMGGAINEFIYSPATFSSDAFDTIVLDLSAHTGTSFDLVMEHVAEYTPETDPTRSTAFVDNVKLYNATCSSPLNIVATPAETGVTLNWESDSSQWEIMAVNHDAQPLRSGTIINQMPYTLANLTPATGYDIYLRSVCGNTTSGWVKTVTTTLPTPVTVPYTDDYGRETLGEHVAPQYNNSSNIIYSPFSGSVAMIQKEKGDVWVGGTTTTEQQAWNDNKNFTSGITYRVDATNVISLQAVVRLRQQYYGMPNHSWYRLKVNGVQFGSSRNPTDRRNERFTEITYDLSEFAGTIVEITLEHCGRQISDYNPFLTMDLTVIDWVAFTGNPDPETCIITTTTLPDLTVTCGNTYENITHPVITDACGNSITGTADASLFPITTEGTVPVTWTFANAAYTTSITQNIIYDDTILPVITDLPAIWSSCIVTAEDVTPPTATDDCAGIITATTTTVFPITVQGLSFITWQYNDGNGNIAENTQEVYITDDAPVPAVAELPLYYAQCFVNFEDVTPPTATDNCRGSLTATTTTPFPITGAGITTVQWVFYDGVHTVYQNQEFIITNTDAPVPDIATLPDVYIQCGNLEEITTPSATQSCQGSIYGTLVNSFPLPQGATTITWQYTDMFGNTTTQTQNVIVEDVQAPVIDIDEVELTLNANGTATLTANLLSGGISDNCNDAVQITIGSQVFDCSNLGTNTVIVTATDIHGNAATASITVSLTDPQNYCTTNGITNPVAESIFTVYPNPTQGLVSISGAQGIAITGIKVYNPLGQMAKKSVVYNPQSGLYTVEISDTATGLYLITAETSKGTFTQKVMKVQ